MRRADRLLLDALVNAVTKSQVTRRVVRRSTETSPRSEANASQCASSLKTNCSILEGAARTHEGWSSWDVWSRPPVVIAVPEHRFADGMSVKLQSPSRPTLNFHSRGRSNTSISLLASSINSRRATSLSRSRPADRPTRLRKLNHSLLS